MGNYQITQDSTVEVISTELKSLFFTGKQASLTLSNATLLVGKKKELSPQGMSSSLSNQNANLEVGKMRYLSATVTATLNTSSSEIAPERYRNIELESTVNLASLSRNIATLEEHDRYRNMISNQSVITLSVARSKLDRTRNSDSVIKPVHVYVS